MRALLLALWLASFTSAAQVAPWPTQRSVTILAKDGDPRIALVHEAIEYWNGVFAEIGSPFRLGPARVMAGEVPGDELRELSRQVPYVGRMPASVADTPGDLVVALSGGDFISFAVRWPADGKALAAIKSPDLWPLTLPNVARNVVAHEIGHALGLRHNADPTMLMCGRPAPCRPDAFQAERPRIFPLTEREREALRRLYPLP